MTHRKLFTISVLIKCPAIKSTGDQDVYLERNPHYLIVEQYYHKIVNFVDIIITVKKASCKDSCTAVFDSINIDVGIKRCVKFRFKTFVMRLKTITIIFLILTIFYFKKDWTAGLKPINNPFLLLVGLANNIKC